MPNENKKNEGTQNENYNVYLDMTHGLFLKFSSIPSKNAITQALINAKQSKQTSNMVVFPQKIDFVAEKPKRPESK